MPEIYHYLQQLVNGLTVGSTYALIAIGYTMVYGIIGMINFAHGEVYMIGSYIAFIAITRLDDDGAGQRATDDDSPRSRQHRRHQCLRLQHRAGRLPPLRGGNRLSR